jgi:class 3 adenylate cyclase
VTDLPETRFAKNPDGLRTAYQIFGHGPIDLLLCLEAATNPVDLLWEEPRAVHTLNRLGRFSRGIAFDPRGMGSSDKGGFGSLDVLMDDMTAVLKATGSEKIAIVGMGTGGPGAMLYAATYPERVSALVLFNCCARVVRTPDYPCGIPPELMERYMAVTGETWGTLANLEIFAPSMAADEHWTRWFLRCQRLSLSPDQAEEGIRYNNETAVQDVLPSIQVPTLVLHRRGDRYLRVEHGRFLAEHIPGASYKDLDGDDHVFFAGDTDAVIDEIEEFLTGIRPTESSERVLTTVMFTDIVGSSQTTTQMGDHAWRTLLDAHDAVVRTQLERHRGHEIKTTGDGFLATFDGPARAIRCACAIRDSVGGLGLDLRTGLHTGEVELRGDDVAGIAVVIGQRVSAQAGPGDVLVTTTVRDLVAGSGIEFADEGEYELKGVSGTWRLLSVTG